jgi:TRAP-type mannitol/chloroaromatic compound transport system substrate-binding protein
MERRDFVRAALTGAAGLGALGGCRAESSGGGGPAAPSRQRITWRLASSFPRSLDTIYGVAEVLAQRLEKVSGGLFQLRVYPAGELVPALQVLDAVQQNTVQVGHTASYYFTGKDPALAFDCCVPFGLTSRQQTAWLTEGGGRELLSDIFAQFNLLAFPAGNTGAQMGGWFKRPIEGAADIQGLKMRIPGLGGQVMSRLGATVQVLPGGDIYPALERGAIDATEWVGPYDDEKLGFHKVAKYYYYPGWWEPGPNLSYLVNRDAWAKLPAEFQAMFEAAAAESATIMQARYDARNPAALERLIAAGVELRPFSQEILLAAEAATRDLMEEEAANNATYRRIYEAWKEVRRSAFHWFSKAELAYSQFAFRDGGANP